MTELSQHAQNAVNKLLSGDLTELQALEIVQDAIDAATKPNHAEIASSAAAMNEHLARHHGEIKTVTDELDATRMNLLGAQDKHDALAEEHGLEKQRHAETASERDNFRGKIESLKTTAKELQDSIDAKDKQVFDLTEKVNWMEKSNKAATDEIARLATEVATWKANVDTMERSGAEQVKRADVNQKDLTAANAKIADLETMLAEATKKTDSTG